MVIITVMRRVEPSPTRVQDGGRAIHVQRGAAAEAAVAVEPPEGGRQGGRQVLPRGQVAADGVAPAQAPVPAAAALDVLVEAGGRGPGAGRGGAGRVTACMCATIDAASSRESSTGTQGR